MREVERGARMLETIPVWGIYLLFYFAVFSALAVGAFVTARQIVLGG